MPWDSSYINNFKRKTNAQEGTDMEQTITIIDRSGGFGLPLLILALLSGMIMYLLITIIISKRYVKKLEKAEELITEGHIRAQEGRKDDGIFKETKRLRNAEDKA